MIKFCLFKTFDAGIYFNIVFNFKITILVYNDCIPFQFCICKRNNILIFWIIIVVPHLRQFQNSTYQGPFFITQRFIFSTIEILIERTVRLYIISFAYTIPFTY